MNRFGRLLIVVGLPLIAIVGFALATNRGATLPDSASALLAAYLTRTTGVNQPPARVVQTAIASRATRFTRDLSAYSLGSGLYYGVTDLVNRPAYVPFWTPMPDTPIPPTSTPPSDEFAVQKGEDFNFNGSGLHALRYPPDAIMCVLVERGSKYEVVVLAEHRDSWNAEWVLHTSTLSPQDLIETLGCDLNLPQ